MSLANDGGAFSGSAPEEKKKRKQTSSKVTKPPSPEKRQRTSEMMTCPECEQACTLMYSQSKANPGKRYWRCPKHNFRSWWVVPDDFAKQHTTADLKEIANKMGIKVKAKQPQKAKLVQLITHKQSS
jgi:hypothetical protein